MPAADSDLDRTGAEGVDADSGGSDVGREVAHRRLERGLRDAHHVVVREHALALPANVSENGAAVLHAQLGGARPRPASRRSRRARGGSPRATCRRSVPTGRRGSRTRPRGSGRRGHPTRDPPGEERVDLRFVGNVARRDQSAPTLSTASGCTRRSESVTGEGKPSLAPSRLLQRWAIPHAMLRSFATPMTSARFRKRRHAGLSQPAAGDATRERLRAHFGLLRDPVLRATLGAELLRRGTVALYPAPGLVS